MPAHWCIYKLMFYIHLIKYLFYMSEYKVMLIQLLICHIYIYIYIRAVNRLLFLIAINRMIAMS